MIIKDLRTGQEHQYGSNQHDALIVSEDGRTLSFYNLQNGDGSRFGDYRFISFVEDYVDIGGASLLTPLELEECDNYLLFLYREHFLTDSEYFRAVERFNKRAECEASSRNE